MLRLEGTFCPLPTPFTDDGSSLSEIRFERLAIYAGKMGCDGFVVGGAAGEFGALSTSERKRLFEWTLRAAPGFPWLGNVSSMSTSKSLDLALHAAHCGARAAILMPPFLGDCTDVEMSDFFRMVAHHAQIPVVAVDPLHHLSSAVKERIAEDPRVWIALPVSQSADGQYACFDRPTTDEFAVDGAASLPMALFLRRTSPIPDLQLAAVRALIRANGVARVAKSTEDLLGFDLGPLRGPLQMLPVSALDALAALRPAA